MNQNPSEFIDQVPFLLMALCAGVILGFIFFGGLWWTVKKMQIVKQPGLLCFVSFLTRIGIVVFGIYWVGDGHWQRLAVCMLGFLLARFVVIRRTDLSDKNNVDRAIVIKSNES